MGNYWLELIRGMWRAQELADYPTAPGELMLDKPASVSKAGRVAAPDRAGCEWPLSDWHVMQVGRRCAIGFQAWRRVKVQGEFGG